MARPSYIVRDGYSSIDQGGDKGKVKSWGSQIVACDLDQLVNYWTPTNPQSRPMLQVAQGHKWCSCCGEVRPFGMFNFLVLDAPTLALLSSFIRMEVQTLFSSPIVARLDYTTTHHLFKWCRACQILYAPETMGLQYCPHCEVGWQDSDNFSSLKAKYCRIHEAARKKG